MTTTLWFVGIDVSKFRLDVATRPESERVSVRNDEAGVRELIQRLTCLRPHLVVLEATGGLETLVVSRLAAAAIPVVVILPFSFASQAPSPEQAT